MPKKKKHNSREPIHQNFFFFDNTRKNTDLELWKKYQEIKLTYDHGYLPLKCDFPLELLKFFDLEPDYISESNSITHKISNKIQLRTTQVIVFLAESTAPHSSVLFHPFCFWTSLYRACC